MSWLNYRYAVILCFLGSVFCFSQSSKILLEEGEVAYEQGEFSKAATAFEKSIDAFGREGNTKDLYRAYNGLGNSFSMMGNINGALKNYLLSVKFSEKNGNKAETAKILKNIGALYSEQKDFPEAMKFYDQAIKYAGESNDKELEADCQNNKGVIYEQQNQYPKALEAYKQAEAIYVSENMENRLDMIYSNLAIVYKYLGNYKESMIYYKKALEQSEKTGDKFLVSAIKNNMGNLYVLMGDYLQSLKLCRQAYDEAKAIDAREVIMESCDGMAVAYEKMKNYPQAILYRKLYEQKKDSLINTERSEQIAELQIKYETEKKEHQIRLLEQQEKINQLELNSQMLVSQRKTYFIIAGLLLACTIGIYSYFLFRKEKKLAEKHRLLTIKETEENERRRMARDIHDDLGSGLSKIRFLAESLENLQAEEVFRSKIKAINETAYHLVDTMRDMIWAFTPSNHTLENVLIRIREFSNDYFNDFPVETTIIIPENVPDYKIKPQAGRNLFSAVKETMQNVMKHAGASHFELKITIEEEQISVLMKDNGKGFDPAVDFTGNGLKNLKARIASISGSVTIENNKGTAILIRMDMKQLTQQS